ncbi:metallophosphoesterase, partial [bacterium]
MPVRQSRRGGDRDRSAAHDPLPAARLRQLGRSGEHPRALGRAPRLRPLRRSRLTGNASSSPPVVRGVERRPKRVSRRKVLRWSAGLLAGSIAVDAMGIEPNGLVFETITVPIRDLPVPFEGYRIAFVTDTHWPRNIDRTFIRAAIDMGLAFRPDLFLFGGDFIDTWRLNDVPKCAGVFEGPVAQDGVFGVLGNHDWALDGVRAHTEIERTSPIRILMNEHVLLRRGGETIALGGLEDLWRRYPDLEATLKGIPPEMPRLLLSHNPDTAEMYIGSSHLAESRRVDLQISGHTHGGEINLPFLGPPHIPSKYGNKFSQGLVQGALHRVYVSRGITSPRGIRF